MRTMIPVCLGVMAIAFTTPVWSQVTPLACEDQEPNVAARENMLITLDHGRKVVTLISHSNPLTFETIRWDENVIEYRSSPRGSFVLNRHTGEIRLHHRDFGISRWICKPSKPAI